MGKTSFLLLFSIGITSGASMAQKRNDAQWIDHLKKTPVDELESGLSNQTFHEWFKALVKPNRTEYKVGECDVENPSENATEHMLCVRAYTKPPQPGDQHWIQITFVVGERIPQRAGEKKHLAYWLLRAIEGPTDPKSRRPDNVFSTLADLEELVRGSAKSHQLSAVSIQPELPSRPERSLSRPCAPSDC